MTQQPKVSVLISFYNLAPFVDQTMESVLAQKTDFPVEILCADDGSDDGVYGNTTTARLKSCAAGRQRTPTPSASLSWTVCRAKNMRATSASGG